MMKALELILRLVVAAGLGSFIGIERERLTWAAGLRTHMLVSVGACLIMIVSAYGFSGVLGQASYSIHRALPLRSSPALVSWARA